MSIITISRGSYSRGKEIAENLAQKLGYECTSRDVLLETSKQFNIPEVKLIRAIHDAPSIFDRFKYGKEKYIAFIRKMFLEHIQKDNIVYHGLAGQFFIRGVPNILKVRIIADIEARVKEEMRRENISEKDARYILKKDDEERRKWGLALYGMDTKDSSLYDIVLNISNLTVADAVEILFDAVQRPCFQTTPESKSVLNDMLLAAKAYAAIVSDYPAADVKSKDGVVVVSLETSLALEAEIAAELEAVLKTIDEVKEVRTNIIPF